MLGRSRVRGQTPLASVQDATARELHRLAPGLQLQGIDVDPSRPTSGQVLSFDGRKWAPATPAASIVISPSPTDGQILIYNASTQVWVPTTPTDDSTPLPDQMPMVEINDGNTARIHPADSLTFIRATLSDGNQYTRTFTSPNYFAVDITSGGLDTGSPANGTWYAIYLVNDSGTLSARFSTSFVAPTGFAAYRYIGAVRRNASGSFRLAIQCGKADFYFDQKYAGTGGDTASLGTSAATAAGIDFSGFTSPGSHAIHLVMTITATGGASGGTVTYSADSSNWSAGTYFTATQNIAASGTQRMTHCFTLPWRNLHTNANRVVTYNSSVTGTAAISSQEVACLGYLDGSAALR